MINIPATKSSPHVLFPNGEDILTITGECYPENPFDFFDPIFRYLRDELPKMEQFHLKVKVPYMNSSSTKCMLDLLDLVADAESHGCSSKVTWLYDKDNYRALELAEEFREDIEISFQIVPIEENPPA